ncbi:MAG: LysM peptidoglycan-binding domain-containing protein [Rhodoglobus sp.]|nr:LysM peptidoglycan-binding domain-containing protein [Rhodoglobus sp.]
MSTAVIAPGFGYSPIRSAPVESRPKLRLTKRGRAVLMFLAATPIVIGVLLFALNGGGATASLDTSVEPFQHVTVASGQSLWQVAESLAPTADPRDVITDLMRLNGLESANVYAGQELAVPAKYLP